MMRPRVGGVIVTYNPDWKTINNIELLLPQVDHLVVVDNSTQSAVVNRLEVAFKEKLTVLRNGKNSGIAAALNKGCLKLLQQGYQWAVTMDQDSQPAPNLISSLVDGLLAFEARSSVALVGCHPLHPEHTDLEYRWLQQSARFPAFFKRTGLGPDVKVSPVDVVITSGCLTSLEVWFKLGQFRTEFFIDYVDTEFCLRAKRNGYHVLACYNALMFHTMGLRTRGKLFGRMFLPLNHSPVRRYYIARNSIVMIREYGLLFPHWLLFDVCASLYNAFRILMFESHRRRKIAMCIRGFRDGLLGRMGALQDWERSAEVNR